MSKTKLVFNSPGFKAILNTDGTQKLVDGIAQEIAEKANANYGGDGFKVKTQKGNYGGGRWISFVTATDKKSLEAESEESALTRAL